MKRSDLPLLSIVTVPFEEGRATRDVVLVHGSAEATHLFGVVRLPDGLPASAETLGGMWDIEQPLLALVCPASRVERIDYELIKQVTAAEQAEKAAAEPA